MMFMDRLFKKYADPFSLVDGYIGTGRFCEFIDAFCDQEKEDQKWEYFLHKVWDQSFNEFCESLQTSENTQGMSDSEIETTVKKSAVILGNFSPIQDGDE